MMESPWPAKSWVQDPYLPNILVQFHSQWVLWQDLTPHKSCVSFFPLIFLLAVQELWHPLKLKLFPKRALHLVRGA